MSDEQQVSGKVFRYLSSMHSSLNKAERNKYREFDPDQWYPWDAEVAGEFTDLMKRSPRETAFGKGFAYVAQKSVPDGSYIPTAELLANLDRLPAAYKGPDGSGYQATVDGEGQASVVYRGMPGFKNVCIAVMGELGERLRASGAKGLDVKHGETCRLRGGDVCEFEVTWSGEAAPKSSEPLDLSTILGGADSGSPAVSSAEAVAPAAAPTPTKPAVAATPSSPVAAATKPPAEPRPTRSAARPSRTAAERVARTPARTVAPAQPGPASGDAAGGSAQDLFDQLQSRLRQAEEQAGEHARLEAEIEELRDELEAVRAESADAVAEAKAETQAAWAALSDLKTKLRDLAS